MKTKSPLAREFARMRNEIASLEAQLHATRNTLATALQAAIEFNARGNLDDEARSDFNRVLSMARELPRR